jgi:hypothetical protein
MDRRKKGKRITLNNNVPGLPGNTPFIPTNGGGPGRLDPRSAGHDGQAYIDRNRFNRNEPLR